MSSLDLVRRYWRIIVGVLAAAPCFQATAGVLAGQSVLDAHTPAEADHAGALAQLHCCHAIGRQHPDARARRNAHAHNLRLGLEPIDA